MLIAANSHLHLLFPSLHVQVWVEPPVQPTCMRQPDDKNYIQECCVATLITLLFFVCTLADC
jgi:hypothetical protein